MLSSAVDAEEGTFQTSLYKLSLVYILSFIARKRREDKQAGSFRRLEEVFMRLKY